MAYFDYQKYKREHHLIILLSFLFPTLSHAQYVDNEKCCISFKTYENHQGILEYIKENVTYQSFRVAMHGKLPSKTIPMKQYGSIGKKPTSLSTEKHQASVSTPLQRANFPWKASIAIMK